MSLRYHAIHTEQPRCKHRHEVNDRVFICQRIMGHEGDHHEYMFGLTWSASMDETERNFAAAQRAYDAHPLRSEMRERPVLGTLSDVPGAQMHTRTKSLVRMSKEELVERVLLVEDHCRKIDAQLHTAWQEEKRIRSEYSQLESEYSDLRWRMSGLEK